MEKDYGSVGYTNQARVISQALRKITRKISKQQVALVFLNQTREKIGVMYGDKVATFGGKAVSFHSSVRVQLDLSTKLKVVDGKRKKIVGMNTRAVCVKNKTAMPFREAILPIYFGHGVDDEKASYLWLVDNGYITGTQTKSIMLDIFEIKFKASDWAEIYDKYYEGIGNLMLDSIDEGDK
jgi:recombination protein RecA